MTEHPSPLGDVSRILTLLLWLLLAASAAAVGFLLYEDAPALGGSLSVLLLMILPITAAFEPQSVAVGPEGVTVRRRLGQLHIPADRITAVEVVPFDALGIRLRLFGSGGLHGHLGWFSSDQGTLLLLASRHSDALVIRRTEGPPVVTTPDDPEGLVAAWEAR